MVKKSLVIDVHNHYMTEGVAKRIGWTDSKNAAPKGGFATSNKRAMEIESRLRVMDEAGVDIAVLEESAFSHLGLEACREMNDAYAKVVRDYPDRLIPCIHVPLGGNPEIIQELDRAANQLEFRCLSLPTSTPELTLDSEEMFPLYEKLSRWEMPIFVHPATRTPIWGGGAKYKLASHVSREYEIAKAVVEVMYGVLTMFPDLKFVMPHHGGGIPALKGRLMAWFEPEDRNIPEAIKGLPKTPRELTETGLDKAFEELFGKVYFDISGFGGWMPITEAAVKVIRPDRLCLGTDYPLEIHEAPDIKAYISNIKQLDIPAKDKRNILGENVRRLLKLG